MSDFHGKFVWYELMTTDAEAATAFYRAAIGWTARDANIPDDPYTLMSAGGADVAGLAPLPQRARDAGARPRWDAYVAVENVDVFADRVADAGGIIHHGPGDIPNVGRFAVVSDPQGAPFKLFTPLPREQAAPAAAPLATPGTPGHVGWHELHAIDREAAFAFYAGLFGWKKMEAVDMGAMGVYQTFAAGDGPAVGGMMTRGDSDLVRGWLYYFNVAAIDAAVARVTEAGGRLVNGPHQVPGGSWIAHCLDPQHVMFAMVGPTR